MKKRLPWLLILIAFAAISLAWFGWKHRTRLALEAQKVVTAKEQLERPKAPQQLSPGTFRDSIPRDSRPRTFIVHVPPSYKSDIPVPLVLMFHGKGESGVLFEKVGMDKVADREGFIVVYPDALGFDRSWNDGGTGTWSEKNNIDDVGFVSALIDQLETRANIDRGRIYAAGMSMGAMLVHRLGCELSEKIAAIGTVSGTIMVDKCTPSRPVPIIVIHGTADPIVTWDGHPGQGRSHPSVPRTIEIWKQANRCTDNTKSTYLESGNVKGEYQGNCGSDADIVLCTVEGGGHTWPNDANFNASEVLWRFFREHPMG